MVRAQLPPSIHLAYPLRLYYTNAPTSDPEFIDYHGEGTHPHVYTPYYITILRLMLSTLQKASDWNVKNNFQSYDPVGLRINFLIAKIIKAVIKAQLATGSVHFEKTLNTMMSRTLSRSRKFKQRLLNQSEDNLDMPAQDGYDTKEDEFLPPKDGLMRAGTQLLYKSLGSVRFVLNPLDVEDFNEDGVYDPVHVFTSNKVEHDEMARDTYDLLIDFVVLHSTAVSNMENYAIGKEKILKFSRRAFCLHTMQNSMTADKAVKIDHARIGEMVLLLADVINTASSCFGSFQYKTEAGLKAFLNSKCVKALDSRLVCTFGPRSKKFFARDATAWFLAHQPSMKDGGKYDFGRDCVVNVA